MTQKEIDFQKLDELRQKNESVFKLAVEYLFKIGYDNMTAELVLEILESLEADIDSGEDPIESVEEMTKLLAMGTVLCTAGEIREIPEEILLDYIAEEGWRCRV